MRLAFICSSISFHLQIFPLLPAQFLNKLDCNEAFSSKNFSTPPAFPKILRLVVIESWGLGVGVVLPLAMMKQELLGCVCVCVCVCV
jgi:hypothetical protein